MTKALGMLKFPLQPLYPRLPKRVSKRVLRMRTNVLPGNPPRLTTKVPRTA